MAVGNRHEKKAASQRKQEFILLFVWLSAWLVLREKVIFENEQTAQKIRVSRGHFKVIEGLLGLCWKRC